MCIKKIHNGEYGNYKFTYSVVCYSIIVIRCLIDTWRDCRRMEYIISISMLPMNYLRYITSLMQTDEYRQLRLMKYLTSIKSERFCFHNVQDVLLIIIYVTTCICGLRRLVCSITHQNHNFCKSVLFLLVFLPTFLFAIL